MKVLLKGASVYSEKGFIRSDLAIDGGCIRTLQESIPSDGFDAVFHLKNLIILPGFADVHVHLREPGFSFKETILTGTQAAARGGYTAVCAMPNLNPPPDSPEHLLAQQEIIGRDAAVHVYPYACITKGQKGSGELADLDALAEGAVAFSDDGKGVQAEELMRQAMLRAKRLGKMIAAHCEDEALLNGGYIHDGWYAKKHGHRGICSESEWGQIQRDLALCRETGCRYHVCHVSTKESVALIRQAKAEGLPVSCETAPHYLLLCEDDLQEHGRFKMNPPLRSREDREALIEGMIDGTIDCIATDHAPHSAEEKSRGLAGSAMGVVGLETAFPALYTGLVKKNILSLEKLVELLSTAPRRAFGLPGGRIEPGAAADLCVWDLGAQYQINPEEFCSKGRSTPFEGMRVFGENRLTMIDGRVVWKKD
ncbi:dihydroorotase [Christensenellaceae bacterium 44-20]